MDEGKNLESSVNINYIFNKWGCGHNLGLQLHANPRLFR